MNMSKERKAYWDLQSANARLNAERSRKMDEEVAKPKDPMSWDRYDELVASALRNS